METDQQSLPLETTRTGRQAGRSFTSYCPNKLVVTVHQA
jgi:hypothetical protein